MSNVSNVGFQQAFISVKNRLHNRMIEVEMKVLEPITVKGFTEICHLEGEKRAMKRETEFLRNVVEIMKKSL